jgi:twitching motility protein PilU
MEQAVQEGCQTFDQALFTLYKEGKITLDQALVNADSMNNLRLKIKLAGLQGDDETEPLGEPSNAEAEANRKTETARGNAFRLRRT